MASRGPRIVLGVCGSIAAYKACELVRALVKSGAEVRPVLTPAASRFVSPLTLGVLAKNPAAQDLFDSSLWDMAHLSLGSWADAVVVAPATADFMAKAASGRAEGLLDSVLLATKHPVAFCPAMDTEMWEHPATQANVSALKGFGYELWGPVKGELASGRMGMGRLLEVQEIAKRSLALAKRRGR